MIFSGSYFCFSPPKSVLYIIIHINTIVTVSYFSTLFCFVLWQASLCRSNFLRAYYVNQAGLWLTESKDLPASAFWVLRLKVCPTTPGSFAVLKASQSTKVHFTPNENIIWPITAIPQSLVPTSVLVSVSIAVERYHNHGSTYKKNI